MRRKLTKLELLQMFADAAARNHTASIAGDYRNANRAAKTVAKAFRQLREMGDEGYQALLTLFEHEDKAVSTMAAAYLLRYATDAAVQILQENARDEGLMGFSAQQALERWREGDWHLDE